MIQLQSQTDRGPKNVHDSAKSRRHDENFRRREGKPERELESVRVGHGSRGSSDRRGLDWLVPIAIKRASKPQLIGYCTIIILIGAVDPRHLAIWNGRFQFLSDCLPRRLL
ncbi:hypothetical protein BDW68DRAFT_82853 [Aspergillus falconensis]